MDSFEPYRGEAETRETIRKYRTEHPPVDSRRLIEIKEAFAAEHPGKIETWRTVWDEFNIGYDKGMREPHLSEAVERVLGITNKKAIDAVSIGKEFDLLIGAEPADSVELESRDEENDTILRLVSPLERPDLYCEDIEQYAEHEKWAELWENYGIENGTTPNVTQLTSFCLNFFDLDDERAVTAAIKVGTMANCIPPQETDYRLSNEQIEPYWISIWQENNTQLEDTLAKRNIIVSIVRIEDFAIEKAEEIVNQATERGELYSPDDASNELAINDLPSNQGPEIKRKIGINNDGYNSDEVRSESHQESDSGDSPGSKATSENREAESSPGKNGTATGTVVDSLKGQIETNDGDPDTNTSHESGSSTHHSSSKFEYNKQRVWRDTPFGFLPTIGPENSMMSQDLPRVKPSDRDGVPDDYETHSNHALFNLDFPEVTGIKQGYHGECPFCPYDSDSFSVFDDKIGYCRKFDVLYTPESAVLVIEGERHHTEPGGSFSSKDKFVFWRYVRENAILDVTIPKEALIHYALSNELARLDDVVEREDMSEISEDLPVDIICDTLAAIGEAHSFDILWDRYDSEISKPDTNGDSNGSSAGSKPGAGESGSGASAESMSRQKSGSEEHSSAGESGKKERATSSASASPSRDDRSQTIGVADDGDTTDTTDTNEAHQSTGDDDDEEIPNTTTVEDGVNTDELFDGLDGVDNPNDNDDEHEVTSDADDDGTTKFQTYVEPETSNPSIDVDIDAVAQFIEHHATTAEADESDRLTRTDTMMDAFDEWAEINDVALDEIDSSVYDNHRKGDFKDALEATHNIEKSRRRLDDDNVMVYHPVSLNDDILNLIE